MTTLDFVRMLIKERGRPVKVGLYGLGKGNTALLYRLIEEKNCKVSVRSDNECALPIQGIPVYFGESAKDIYEDLLILSPSARRDAPHILRAKERGTIVSSECDIFFMKRIGTRFAVSGSDGKSSTVTLSALMLEGAFPKVFTIGNIGVPYSVPPQGDEYGYVCELSSFNLEYIKPDVERCLITNISENHINWHGSFENYIKAKLNLIENAREVVLPADDDILSRAMAGRRLFAVYSANEGIESLKTKFEAEHYVYIRDGYLTIDGEPLISADSLALKTEYAIKNALGSVALTLGYAKREAVLSALCSFKGLAHRCQLCYTGGGIDCFDSSIDTSPARTVSTLNSLGREVNIILGGQGKRLSLTPLVEPLRKYARSIAVYGEMRDEFFSLIENDEALRLKPHEYFPTFRDAVVYLLERAERGESILLSPGCASYGEFCDFEARGDAFSRIVKDYFEKE